MSDEYAFLSWNFFVKLVVKSLNLIKTHRINLRRSLFAISGSAAPFCATITGRVALFPIWTSHGQRSVMVTICRICVIWTICRAVVVICGAIVVVIGRMRSLAEPTDGLAGRVGRQFGRNDVSGGGQVLRTSDWCGLIDAGGAAALSLSRRRVLTALLAQRLLLVHHELLRLQLRVVDHLVGAHGRICGASCRQRIVALWVWVVRLRWTSGIKVGGVRGPRKVVVLRGRPVGAVCIRRVTVGVARG